MDLTILLGVRYESIEDVVDSLQQDEIVVTDNNETYYCVKSDVFFDKLQPLGYIIVQ